MKTIETNLKRICDLKVGDKFYLDGIERTVYQITETTIYHRFFGKSHNNRNTFGAKSQAKVEMVKEKELAFFNW